MRMIDADALLKGKDDHQIISTHLIWNAPTVDAVEVVRCKDCKHRTELCGDGWHPCTDMAVNDNWYCADGERKEKEND